MNLRFERKHCQAIASDSSNTISRQNDFVFFVIRMTNQKTSRIKSVDLNDLKCLKYNLNRSAIEFI